MNDGVIVDFYFVWHTIFGNFDSFDGLLLDNSVGKKVQLPHDGIEVFDEHL